MTSTLRTLLDRVEKGEGADREIDRDLHAATHAPPPRGCVFGRIPPYTASVDAAVALVEKMLPDWGRLLYWNNCQGHTARLEDNANEYTGSTGAEFEARGATAPLALLAALLRAKIAQEEGA